VSKLWTPFFLILCVEVIVFNATSNNISVISCLSVLLVENLMLCISLDTAFSIQNYVINFACDLWQVGGMDFTWYFSLLHQ